MEQHPHLFYRAKGYEKVDADTGRNFTWVQGSSLIRIEREKDNIKERAARAKHKTQKKQTLYDQFEEFAPHEDEEDPGEACMICHL